MDKDVQKNTADIADLDKRMSSHEAMCEERWKTCVYRFHNTVSLVGRLESILIAASGSLIVGGAVLILTMWNIHV